MIRCPECGKPTTLVLDMLGRVNRGDLMPQRCKPCLDETARRVEAHAAVYAPLLMSFAGMRGRFPRPSEVNV